MAAARNPGRFESVDNKLAERYRSMTPQERLSLGFSMWDVMVSAAEAGIRYHHPDWNEQQVKQEIVQRIRRAAG
jgi:hypothetical protein